MMPTGTFLQSSWWLRDMQGLPWTHPRSCGAGTDTLTSVESIFHPVLISSYP